MLLSIISKHLAPALSPDTLQADSAVRLEETPATEAVGQESECKSELR